MAATTETVTSDVTATSQPTDQSAPATAPTDQTPAAQPAPDSTPPPAPADTAAPASAAKPASAPVSKPADTAQKTATINVPPAASTAPVKATVNPDIVVGKNLLPDDSIANTALEQALSVLRDQGLTKPSDVAQAQTTLYNVLSRYLVRKEDAETFAFLNNLMTYIEANLDVHFTPKKKFREFGDLPGLLTAQAHEFSILLAILIDAAPTQTRTSTAKNIRWNNVRAELTPANADIILAKLMKFFNVK